MILSGLCSRSSISAGPGVERGPISGLKLLSGDKAPPES